MALLDYDGFDHYIASLISAKGWNPSVAVAMVAGRVNGQAVKLTGGSSSTTVTLTKTVSGMSATTVIAGVAVTIPSGVTNGNTNLVQIMAGATVIASLAWNAATGRLSVTNNAGTTIASGLTSLARDTTYFIEIKLFINGASGTCEVHLNEATEIASTVGNFGSTAADTIKLSMTTASSGGTGGNITFDDFYVCDNTGAKNNDFLGDSHVDALYPNGAGSHSDWTPDTGVTHFSRVNEHTGTFPDGDTSYVTDGTAGHIDSYTFDDLPISSADIFAIKHVVYVRKDDAGTRTLANLIRQGGSDFFGTTLTVGSSYAFVSEIKENDPNGVAWTVSNVNADEFGVKVVA